MAYILKIFNFLAIINFDDIGSSIRQALRTFCGRISAIIYDFIVIEYDLFVTISRAEILDNAFVEEIYEKVGMLLGLFMVFKLTFSLIQHLIDPSKFSDKKTGFASLIKRFVISIVLLGTVPSIFKMAFQVQNYVVGSNNSNNNVIYKLIIGDSISTDIKDFGNKLSSDLFFSFYKETYTNSFNEGGVTNSEGETIEDNYENLKKRIEKGEIGFDETVDYLSLRSNNVYAIEYNEIFSIAVGVIVILLLANYIVQVSIRVIQLAYLQVIAPIPILSYISDPEGSFKKWINQCVSTYLDLFIRVAILYFIVYLSRTVMNSFDNPASILRASIGLTEDDPMFIWVQIFIILGLLLFGKKVPELLKDLFPGLGTSAGKFDFGLKSPKKLWNDYVAGAPIIGKPIGWLGKKVPGMVGGALTGAAVGLVGGHGIKGRAKGLFGGLTKGAVSGAQGKKMGEIASARASQNVKNRQIDNDGSTLGGRIDAKFRDTFGMKSRVEKIDDNIKQFEKQEIKSRKDKIETIQNGRMADIDERIKGIRNSDLFIERDKNNKIISANKALFSEAENQLLKPGIKSNSQDQAASDRLRDLKAKIKWAEDNLSNGLSSTDDVKYFENLYNDALKTESSAWINRHLTDNETVINNMTIISNETGNDVSLMNAQAAKTADNVANRKNTNIARDVQNLEAEVQKLNREKEDLQADIDAINREIYDKEQEKEDMEKSKKKPQADIDATKK